MPRRKAKAKKDSKKKTDQLTRRTVLKMGAAAGAATVIAPTILTSKKSSVFAQSSVTEPIICQEEPDNSPPHHPFVDSLPIPLPAFPTNLNPAPQETANTLAGEAARAPHQRWAEFQPDVEYHLVARAATHRFHSDYLPSYIWAFNGQIPGSADSQRLRPPDGCALPKQSANSDGSHGLWQDRDHNPPAQRPSRV